MLHFIFLRLFASALALLLAGAGMARAEEVIYVDNRVIVCVQTAIPEIVSGKESAAGYVDLDRQVYQALGGGWKGAITVSPEEVLHAMKIAVVQALTRGADHLRDGITSVSVGFTAEPIHKGRDVYEVVGVLKASGTSTYAGDYNFTAYLAVGKNRRCSIRSITVAVIASDAFDLGKWIRDQPEIQAVREKYNLPSAN